VCTNTGTDTQIILASSMDEIQSNIFGMGFGPIPFYRRCSVVVQYDEEEDNGGEITVTKRVRTCDAEHAWIQAPTLTL
jgi:hypothetical protein